MPSGKELLKSSASSLRNPSTWGLSPKLVRKFGGKIEIIISKWKDCFSARSWDNSFYAQVYIEGLLTMESRKTFKNIARQIIGVEDDGQGLQHFMSESPWLSCRVYDKLQKEIAANPHLGGGMLIIDESAEARNDGISAGVSRQYNGRLGKVDSCQVGVGLSYYKSNLWTLVDAGLYMPERWFDDEHKKLWPQLRIPEELQFKTKIQMALEMILQAKENGLPFSMVCFDGLYGRNESLREKLTDEGITYIADIPNDTLVYLEKPTLSIPGRKPGARKYRAWEHHTALTALSLWLIADMKLEWMQQMQDDRELADEFEIKILPALSASNVREMLKACLGRGNLTIEEAVYVAMDKLLGRYRSTMCRLNKQKKGENRKKLNGL